MAVPSSLPVRPDSSSGKRALAGLLLLAAVSAAVLLWWWGGANPPDAAGYGPGAPYLYVLQHESLELVDPDLGTVVARLRIKGERPYAAALTSNGTALFMVAGKRLIALSPANHRLVSQTALSDWGRRVTVSPDGRTVAVSIAEDPEVRLFRWDGARLILTDRLQTGGEPGALLYDDTGRLLYVGLEDAVLALDWQTGVEVFRAPLPKPHQLDPVRRLLRGPGGVLYAYYINADHLGAIAVIDPAGARVRVHETGRVIHDIALSADGQTLYATWRTAVGVIPRRGGLLALDPSTFALKRPELALGWAMGVAVSPDGNHLYVTEARRPFRWDFDFPGALVRVDTASWQVVDRTPIGRLPQAFAENH